MYIVTCCITSVQVLLLERTRKSGIIHHSDFVISVTSEERKRNNNFVLITSTKHCTQSVETRRKAVLYYVAPTSPTCAPHMEGRYSCLVT